MSKREHGQTSEAADMEGSRSKRRKEAAGSSSDVDVAMSDPVGIGGESGGTEGGSKEEVAKEQGLKLWQTVKDAVNKECVPSCLIRLLLGSHLRCSNPRL